MSYIQDSSVVGIMSQNGYFMARLEGVTGLHEKWLYTFFHPIKVPSQNTIVPINLQEVLAVWLSVAVLQARCVLGGVPFVCIRHLYRASRWSSLSCLSGVARFLSKWLCVSGQLQHQTSVTQTSFWFLYTYFMFDFSHFFFLDGCPADKQTHACSLHDHASWHFMVTASVKAFYQQQITPFTTSSRLKGSNRGHAVVFEAVAQAVQLRTLQETSWDHSISESQRGLSPEDINSSPRDELFDLWWRRC